ncbi:hypothetical protein DFH11DRAFT_532860 [Phellopilus nigrolimitatus]|nr:hypothetical protein DFH11DRAFT_532860 [Phellopilus nigrolimitatus]
MYDFMGDEDDDRLNLSLSLTTQSVHTDGGESESDQDITTVRRGRALVEMESRMKSTMPRHLKISGTNVSITLSDGSGTMRPRVIGENRDETGCHYKATDKTSESWREKIATCLVHEGPWSPLYADSSYTRYTLKKFPKGYELYSHRRDGEIGRVDHYLYDDLGSTSPGCRIFSSPLEFVLHAKWLAFGALKDSCGRSLCGCQYCSGKSQTEISARLKERTEHLGPRSSSPGHKRPRKKEGAAIANRRTSASINRGKTIELSDFDDEIIEFSD